MANTESTAQLLKEFSESGNQERTDFAIFFKAFEKSRDPELLKNLKLSRDWQTNVIFSRAGEEFPNTAASITMAEACLGLIELNIIGSTLVYEFLSTLSRHHSAQTALINKLSDFEVSELELSRHLLYSCISHLNFGWKIDFEKDLPFGYGADCRFTRLVPPESLEELSPFESLIWKLDQEDLIKALQFHKEAPLVHGHKSWRAGTLQGSLARFKPAVLHKYLDQFRDDLASLHHINWNYLNIANPAFDYDTLHYTQTSDSPNRHLPTIFLASLRPEQHLESAREVATCSNAITSSHSLVFLADHFPEDLRKAASFFLKKEEKHQSEFPAFILDKTFTVLAKSWDGHGKQLFDQSLQIPIRPRNYSNEGRLECFHANLLIGMLRAGSSVPNDEAVAWLNALMKTIEQTITRADQRRDLANNLWHIVTTENPVPFTADLWELLTEKSKRRRNYAVEALSKSLGDEARSKAGDLLTAKKIDGRLGAIELLIKLGARSITKLQEALPSEKSQKVQSAIEEGLAKLGVESPAIDETPIEDLLTLIESDKRIKLPTAPWFDLAKFPLIQKDGTSLSEKAVTFLIQKQAKHKTIDAAPGILPVLELLDREQNADSALALLNQWLDSDQVAKDRWALVLAGLLGDNRIIPALTPRIQPWCENARHKLAEYAAQAISLLATEEALMILDTLANRYRSKFKNIGKACNAAFLAAAEARGVTPDELGDLVVPNLGFNSECHKEFDDGKIIAVLQPDFKITWLNPETEKETKSPPSNLSDAGKEELKTLRKILREAVKGQTARLEQMLVHQRRWPVARWQELFEEHPLLQSYAANLVWGIYNSDSELLRTFRRYPNGILAHGSGEMEDLEERDTQIGLVHPLELEAETLAIWRDHLGRFKVKPPFLQLDRPVEVLEDDHHNRREITFTKDIQISSGTFLSRTNKRGWVRGSVVDAGGVTSYYKPFEGVGIEAILFLDEYWIGFDPADSFPLGKALFAKLSTVDRGSYIYDDPEPNDPRVLPFGEVPAIVYSEVIADLKALIEGQSK